MEKISSERRSVDLPPWLWLWVGLFLASLPQLVETVSYQREVYGEWQQAQTQMRALDPGRYRLDWLLIPSFLLDLIPHGARTLGVVAIALPWLRRLYVERRYRLTAPPPLPVVTEIVAWVAAQNPRLIVRVNPLRTAPLAFVYPRGWGRSALALFGGLIVLWRADRPAAEAVLRHELAHHARGDVAILGVGSPFEAVVRFAGLYYLALFIAPMVVHYVYGAWYLTREYAALGLDVQEGVWFKVRQLATQFGPGLAGITVVYLLSIVQTLVLPLAGIWVAEIAADRRVADAFGGEEGVRRALAATGRRRVAWWRWLLMRLSHPPLSLRRAALRARGGLASLALLLAFPAAYAVRLAALHLLAALSYAQSGFTGAEVVAQARENTLVFLRAQAPDLLVMGVLLALWPFVAGFWERLWAGAASDVARPALAPYVAGALLLLAIALVGLLV